MIVAQSRLVQALTEDGMLQVVSILQTREALLEQIISGKISFELASNLVCYDICTGAISAKEAKELQKGLNRFLRDESAKLRAQSSLLQTANRAKRLVPAVR